jgi:hypothetical protein
MKLATFVLILVCCIWTFPEAGEIYEWIDENGVKHFSEEPPPKGAKIVKEIEEIPSDNASGQKPVQEGTGAVKKDKQQQEASTSQAAPEGSSGSDDSDDGVIVDPGARRREEERRHDQRKEGRKAKPKLAAGDITDKGEEANLGDPDEKANMGDPGEKVNMGDPDEKSNIDDPDEKKNIGDPEEEKDFKHE